MFNEELDVKEIVSITFTNLPSTLDDPPALARIEYVDGSIVEAEACLDERHEGEGPIAHVNACLLAVHAGGIQEHFICF